MKLYHHAKQFRQWRIKMFRTFVALMSIGSSLAFSGMSALEAYADDNPITVQTAANNDVVTFAHGREEHTKTGVHAVTVIQDTSGNYLFCIQWSKRAPKSQEIQRKVQAEPAVEWLVNNFYSGNRYRSLGMGDLGDYWLYQAVIHWVADPNDHATWGGANGAIQDHLNDLNPSVRQKVEELRAKALSVTSHWESEDSTGYGSLNFSPNNLTINPDQKRPQDNYYQGTINLNDYGVSNARVWLEGQPNGTILEGANGGVDLNNINGNTNLRIKVPWDQVNGSSTSFKIKAHGTWQNSTKVVWVYGDSRNVNQNVARQNVVTTIMDANVEANVTANRRDSIPFRITKKSADGILPGAKFVLVRRTPSGDKDVNISVDQAKKEAYRQVGNHLELTNSGEPYVATADSRGEVHFDNVKVDSNGRYDYYAIEVQAPNGYALSQTAVKMGAITPNGPDTVTAELMDSTIPLPKTGSNQLLIVIASGATLIALAGALGWYQVRKKRG